ncbi:MAG: hypothetical protein U0414_17735 [Polyangiaceae bacterium]
MGHEELLIEAWRRYRTPLAVTEVHLGCTPDQQIRWLAEAHSGALAAREAGADVRAITLWALFGSHDWDSLVTEVRGTYEPGVFDVRLGSPRWTEFSHAVRALVSSGTFPVPAHGRWWRRADRLIHAAVDRRSGLSLVPPITPSASERLAGY